MKEGIVVNSCHFIGNVGKTPEVRFSTNGQASCNFSIACNERWTDKQGQKQERTTWVNISTWGKLAEICGKFLTKGKQVYVSGRLQIREYEKEGQRRTATEIVADNVTFLGGGERQSQPEEEIGF